MEPPEPERNLEQLLIAAADDPEKRPVFSRTLLDSDVYVLGVIDGDAMDGVAQADTSMQIATIADDDGEVTPFFTSEQTLQEYLDARPGTDPRFVRLNCRALFEMTQGSRLVLNPFSDYGKMFLPGEIAALLSGREPGLNKEVMEADREIQVGAPAHVPPELPAGLSRFLAQRPVEEAYLGWIAHPDGHTGYLMVVVAADSEQAMNGFGSAGINELIGGETLDVLVVAPGEQNILLGVVPPFYSLQLRTNVGKEPKRRWRRRG